MPFPKQGFSQYIFASEVKNILATVGYEKTISIDNLLGINREIEKSKRRYQFKMSESQNKGDEEYQNQMPSYSSHVDMKLSHKEFRIFIFPFALDTQLNQTKGMINSLYLVGLLPKYELRAEDSEHWDASLLLVTIVSVLITLTLLRLYLLPSNQSISPFFRNFTLLSSYSCFIVFIAMVLAFMQKTTLQMSKDNEAFAYAKHLEAELNKDLYEVFNGLVQYRPFYHKLLDELDKPNYQKLLKEQIKLKNISKASESVDAKEGYATNFFLRMLRNSLASICKPIGKEKLEGYAFTFDQQYQYSVDCPSKSNGKEESYVSFMQSKMKFAEQAFFDAYQKNGKSTHGLGVMVGSQELEVGKGAVESFYKKSDDRPFPPENIFTIIAINEEGRNTLPSIYLQENNAPPRVLNLTNRDYYKKVRDGQGWDLDLEDGNLSKKWVENVYIQRVLNIGDGTRGTSISMPMYDSDSDPDKDIVDGLAYTIGADVILPSLSLAAPAPYDFTYMVIDRNSGDVLFHSDESRTLIENLYYTSSNRSDLSQWAKAGLDYYSQLSKNIIEGYYHGQPGRFVLIPAPIDAWAIVVFYPNGSLDAFMASQFLLICMSLTIALLGLVSVLFICRLLFRTNALKNKFAIPDKISDRLIIMISSILLGVIYSLYYIGLLIDRAEVGFFSLALPVAGVLIWLLLLYRIYSRYFTAADSNKHINGFNLIVFTTILLLFAAHLYHFYYISQVPLKALGFHYQQIHCNWLNYEKQERSKMAISRYPNSITQQRIEPSKLLPEASEWEEGWNVGGVCSKHSPQAEPSDYPDLIIADTSYLLQRIIFLWQWPNVNKLSSDLLDMSPLAIQRQKKDFDMYQYLVMAVGIIILMFSLWAWLKFVRRMLWKRLYCSNRFLQHIERLVQFEGLDQSNMSDQHHKGLIIKCGRTKLNGIGLALLLRTAVMNENKLIGPKSIISAGFDMLYQFSPCLQNFGVNNIFLPNLKIKVDKSCDNNKLDVKIWDIESCLAQTEFRQHLLDLIMEIKSLTIANQLNSLIIFTEYHSLQRVKMKDPLSVNGDSALGQVEYLLWAECLMDFKINVAEDFGQGLDVQLLEQEIKSFPGLSLLLPSKLDTSETTEEHIENKQNNTNIDAKRATINYILMHAEALYRFKWESCSNAEKLALLNLGKQHSLNPLNTQMIEHLALNGLIRVKQGGLEIANQSFAYFIRNAETTDTVNHLVNQSEVGFWKDYQLPLGLIFVLIIVGIAVISGESLYIIAASAAGIIGTIRTLGGQSK